MKKLYLVMIWIFSVLAMWIGLAYILATFSVLAIPFQDKFIGLLTHFIVISSALIFGTIITAVVYFVYQRFQR